MEIRFNGENKMQNKIKVSTYLKIGFLAILSVVFLIPILLVFMNSFKSRFFIYFMSSVRSEIIYLGLAFTSI